MKHFLIIILAICIVLFVLVPLAYISLGRMPNPWEIAPTTNYNPSYASTSASRGPSAETDVLARVFGGTYAKLRSGKDPEKCTNPATSLAPHVRDAKLMREGASDAGDEPGDSIVSSAAYKLSVRVPGPVTDWQYTAGAMEDEVASFTFDNIIVNILARNTVKECIGAAEEGFRDFHEGSAASEYFSSAVYVGQGKPIGLESAALRTLGKGKVSGHQYYWYLLDEEYAGFEDRPVVTIWYSTYIAGTEYWFAFRTYRALGSDLNAKAEDILDGVRFE